jgi:hypothetical protein
MGFDAGQHHGRNDRLGQVIHGSQPQSGLLIRGFSHGCDEDHWNEIAATIGAKAAHHLEAIHFGHHDIEQHEIRRRVGMNDLQRTLP